MAGNNSWTRNAIIVLFLLSVTISLPYSPENARAGSGASARDFSPCQEPVHDGNDADRQGGSSTFKITGPSDATVLAGVNNTIEFRIENNAGEKKTFTISFTTMPHSWIVTIVGDLVDIEVPASPSLPVKVIVIVPPNYLPGTEETLSFRAYPFSDIVSMKTFNPNMPVGSKEQASIATSTRDTVILVVVCLLGVIGILVFFLLHRRNKQLQLQTEMDRRRIRLPGDGPIGRQASQDTKDDGIDRTIMNLRSNQAAREREYVPYEMGFQGYGFPGQAQMPPSYNPSMEHDSSYSQGQNVPPSLPSYPAVAGPGQEPNPVPQMNPPYQEGQQFNPSQSTQPPPPFQSSPSPQPFQPSQQAQSPYPQYPGPMAPVQTQPQFPQPAQPPPPQGPVYPQPQGQIQAAPNQGGQR